MQQRKTPFGYLVTLDPGDELMSSLERLASEHRIGAASVTGLGAVDGALIGAYSLEKQDYIRHEWDEQLEVCSLTGTLSWIDDEPFAHVHGVFGRPDSSTIGGHIFETVCSVTVELAVHTAPERVTRHPVSHCSLDLMKLE